MKETLQSIQNESHKELIAYMEWVAKNYPKVHEEFMTMCHTCGKKFIKTSKYSWKPTCECLKHLELSRG